MQCTNIDKWHAARSCANAGTEHDPPVNSAKHTRHNSPVQVRKVLRVRVVAAGSRRSRLLGHQRPLASLDFTYQDGKPRRNSGTGVRMRKALTLPRNQAGVASEGPDRSDGPKCPLVAVLRSASPGHTPATLRRGSERLYDRIGHAPPLNSPPETTAVPESRRAQSA